MQDEHAHLRAGFACRERLAVGPDAQHGVTLARIELGYDGDLHDLPTICASLPIRAPPTIHICPVSMPRFTSADG
jgi:hypothetical protein